MPKELKAVVVSTMPIAPIPIAPGNLLALVPFLIKIFVVATTSLLRFLARGLYCD